MHCRDFDRRLGSLPLYYQVFVYHYTTGTHKSDLVKCSIKVTVLKVWNNILQNVNIFISIHMVPQISETAITYAPVK